MYVKHEWTVHLFEAYRKKTQIWSVQPPSSLAVVFWMFALYMWPLCNWVRRPHRNGDEWHKGAVLCGQILFLIVIHKLSIHYEIWCTDITYVCAHFCVILVFYFQRCFVGMWEMNKSNTKVSVCTFRHCKYTYFYMYSLYAQNRRISDFTTNLRNHITTLALFLSYETY